MKNEDLSKRARAWSAAAKASANGPLVIAADVCEVADNWDDVYRQAADGLTVTEWLRTVFGTGGGCSPAWWRRRRDAVTHLGEEVRRNLDHRVAVWLAQRVSPTERRACVRELVRQCHANGKVPLNPSQARTAVAHIWKAKGAGCRSCRALRKRIEELEALLSMGSAAE